MDIFTMIMACSLYRDNAITNAMVQLGSGNNPLLVTVIAAQGESKAATLPNPAAAANYTRMQLAKGYQVRMGLMQVSNHWLNSYKGRLELEDLFRPCKNMVVATDILNQAARTCAEQGIPRPSCALSLYHSQDIHTGNAYAKQILSYAKQHPMANNPQNQPNQDEQITEYVLSIKLPTPGFTGEQVTVPVDNTPTH